MFTGETVIKAGKTRGAIGSCSLNESKMLPVFLFFSPQFQCSVTISSLLPITDPILGDPAVMAFKFQLRFLIVRDTWDLGSECKNHLKTFFVCHLDKKGLPGKKVSFHSLNVKKKCNWNGQGLLVE